MKTTPTQLSVFEGQHIRKLWHNNEWYFSVIDVVGALTESSNPRNYWNMLKTREEEQGIELYTNCVQLKILADDGKMREKLQLETGKTVTTPDNFLDTPESEKRKKLK